MFLRSFHFLELKSLLISWPSADRLLSVRPGVPFLFKVVKWFLSLPFQAFTIIIGVAGEDGEMGWLLLQSMLIYIFAALNLQRLFFGVAPAADYFERLRFTSLTVFYWVAVSYQSVLDCQAFRVKQPTPLNLFFYKASSWSLFFLNFKMITFQEFFRKIFSRMRCYRRFLPGKLPFWAALWMTNFFYLPFMGTFFVFPHNCQLIVNTNMIFAISP